MQEDFENPIAKFPRGTIWHIIHHFIKSSPHLDAALYVAENPVHEIDIAISERLINNFHSMYRFEQNNIAPEKRPNEGVWEMSKHAFHGDAYGLLFNRDVHGFANYMSNAMRRTLTHGLGPGQQVFEAFCDSQGEGQKANVLILLDRLAALAESVGALPYENPEQGRYGENIMLPFEDMVAAIEAKIGTEIHRPPVMGNFGLNHKGNIIDFRVPDDVYSAFRLKSLSEQYGLASVCEIGGGLGGLAFQSIRFGFQHYHIFDLPIINLVQGYFLMRIFGPDKVRMFDENVGSRPLTVLPYWEFFNRDWQFDLVFNRDSLPEIPRARAEEYLREIEARGCTFLSINQECEAEAGRVDLHQLNVFRMMQDHPAMRCWSRHPYWIRKGYVEELYRPA